jgi:hypothetical protein
LLAGLAEIGSFAGIADYCEINLEQLGLHFDLSNGTISHDTFRKVFGTSNPEMFQTCFTEFTKNLASAVSGVIAIDDKTDPQQQKRFSTSHCECLVRRKSATSCSNKNA